AFSEKLACQARATRTQCQAQRNLLLTNSSAGEQQISDIGAGDEKDEPDGTKQNEERWPDLSNYLFVERDHNGAPPFVISRILLLKACRDRIHLGLRLLQSDAGFKASNNFEEVITALRRFFRWKCNRHPELIVPVFKTRQLHKRRHDSNNGVALAVQSDCAANNAWIGSEASLPQ